MRFEFSCGAGVPVSGHWSTLTALGLLRSHCFEADSVEEALLVCDLDIGDGGGHGWRGPEVVFGLQRWTRRPSSDLKRGGRGGIAILELIGEGEAPGGALGDGGALASTHATAAGGGEARLIWLEAKPSGRRPTRGA